MQVVILAGGKGTRLKQYTENIPKPMVKIFDKTMLEYQFDNLKKYGLTDIVISIGHLGHKIKEYYKDGSKFGVSIKYINEEEPMGTGGALYYLKNIIKDDFILLFGDIFLNIDWDRFIKFHEKNKGIGTFLVHPNNHPYDSDLIYKDSNNKITSINFKNTKRDLYNNLVKSGVHILSPDIFKYVKFLKKQDFEKQIICNAIENEEKFFAYKTSEYVKDMGTINRLQQLEQDLKNKIPEKKALYNKQKCIFLDRDGTVNKYKGLLYKKEQFELEYKVEEAIKRINDSGYLCVLITNQPVIARNLCTIEEVENIHKKLETLLGEKGAYLDDIFYCPHHPDSGYPEENKLYKIKCNCRKPNIGLIEAAQKKYNIDLKKSFIIGDTTVDIKTGENAGMHTILVKTGQAALDNKFDVKAEHEAENLYEVINYIFCKEVK